MSAPVLASRDDTGRRFYTFGDPPESFWSVTTIISGGVPKHLQAHYAKLAAELAYDAILERGPNARASSILKRLADRGRAHVLERQAAGELKSIKVDKLSTRDLALRWIKGAADRHRDAAAERGTAVHDEAEALVLTHAREASRLYVAGEAIVPWREDLRGYQLAFQRFLDDWHPEYLATEATVFNRTEAYAGTLDSVMRLHLTDGSVITPVVDYKSGRETYAEVGMQNAAYARGEFVGAPDGVTELPMPVVDSGAVLHLRADGTYRLRLVRIDQAVFDAFRFAREVYRWREELARTVFLQDLTPVTEEVA